MSASVGMCGCVRVCVYVLRGVLQFNLIHYSVCVRVCVCVIMCVSVYANVQASRVLGVDVQPNTYLYRCRCECLSGYV